MLCLNNNNNNLKCKCSLLVKKKKKKEERKRLLLDILWDVFYNEVSFFFKGQNDSERVVLFCFYYILLIRLSFCNVFVISTCLGWPRVQEQTHTSSTRRLLLGIAGVTRKAFYSGPVSKPVVNAGAVVPPPRIRRVYSGLLYLPAHAV